jgi:maltose O-acetyltransferase
MKIKGKNISLLQILCLLAYYGLLTYLPVSTFPIIGKLSRNLRYLCCKNIFLYCGHNVNIERKAKFGSGINLSIGDNSGIGVNCVVPSDINVGNNVMMGPNCYILHANHEIDRTDIPMIDQGYSSIKQTIIEDDVWIGRQVLFTPGRIVKKGSIVGAGCILTKDFPEYSIIGGNPSKLIRKRN